MKTKCWEAIKVTTRNRWKGLHGHWEPIEIHWESMKFTTRPWQRIRAPSSGRSPARTSPTPAARQRSQILIRNVGNQWKLLPEISENYYTAVGNQWKFIENQWKLLHGCDREFERLRMEHRPPARVPHLNVANISNIKVVFLSYIKVVVQIFLIDSQHVCRTRAISNKFEMLRIKENYYTNALILRIKIMLWHQFHGPKVLK